MSRPPRSPRPLRAVLVPTIALTLGLGTLPAVADEAYAVSFDFGPGSAPVAEGWTGVTETTLYDAARGHGIELVDGSTPISRLRTNAAADPVANDFVLGTSWRFLADVPDGRYEVTLHSGDQLTGTSTTRTNVSLEGVPAGSVSSRQAVSTATWATEVTDGQLTVDITGAGAGGYVNGLEVVSVGGDPGAEPDPDEPDEDEADLAAPRSLRTARVTDDAVSLRWDEVSGAAGYRLSRADDVDGPFTEVTRAGQREVLATDSGLDTTTAHYYRVQALDAAGVAGPASAVAVSSLSSPAPELEDGVLRLDLGSGETAPGAVRVDATTAYGTDQRVGFVDVSEVSATDRGTDDPLRSDFVTVGDTELVVDVPVGDYTVDLIAGDATGGTDVAITVEEMAKVQQTAKAAGEYLEMSFDIAVVDGQLNLELTGTAANLNSLVLTRQQPREEGEEPTLWLTGDSTVQTYTADYAPQAGWGQMLDRFMSDDVTVTNKAIGGRSSKNFISQGRLDEVLLDIRPGDYLFVQFGHNDNSYGVDDRWAAPADYAEYLRTYIEGARQRGATPVVVTPVSRRAYGADGTADVSFPGYVDAARAVAAETGTALVDLSASSRAYLTEIGPEAARSVFLHVPAGVYPGRPNGTTDDTHFQEYGAIQMARLVATGVAALDDPLAAEVEEVEPPAEVPATPTAVVAGAVSSSMVQLSWAAVEGADIYEVHAKEADAGEDAYRLVTTSTLPQAGVTGLVQGVTYDLRVVAVNGRGDSAPSAAVRVTTRSPLFAFDMQLPGNPTQAGFTAVDPTTAYTAERGYGFTTTDPALAGRDRGTGFDPVPSDLERDFLLPGGDRDFVVDVPNGSYAVKVHYGDPLGSGRLGVTIEGRDYGSSNSGRGTVSEKVLQPVHVTDGQLTVVADGWWNGMEVTALQLAPTGLALDDLSVDGSDVSVSLSWQGTEDATGYRVYRRAEGANQAEALPVVTEPRFVDTTAEIGLVYVYTVVALDGAGTESVPSGELEVTTVDPDVATVPAPSGLAVGEVTKNSVALSWEPVEGAVYYRVLRAGPGEEMAVVASTTGTDWVDTDVLTTVEYRYAVASVNGGGVSEPSEFVTSPADTELLRQAERLDRSPVAVAVEDGVYLGWRMLGLDPDDIAFHIYRDGERITDSPVTGSTNLLDEQGDEGSSYRISTVVNGIERWAGEEFQVWGSQTLDVPLDKPADAYTKDGQPYSYRANDASVGDLDGDGQYEIVLKWDPTNSADNSRAGYTGNVYVDAYELDGTRLWRIDLGQNIRAGAHYTQFQVFDLDGDGTAEVSMKTADGTVDGQGAVIGDPRADHRNSSGYVLTGPEYLSVFDGRTGAARATEEYVPPRGSVGSWGDTYGNRVDRFLAGVAYLDGEHPSLVMSRGYYTRTVIAAWDFDGSQLTQRWVFDSAEAGDEHAGQGNHQFSVADVDGDQLDEIVFGSMTIDDDGDVLHNTGLGHGDALHVSEFDPSRPGQEVFAAHESMAASGNQGATFRDAETGEVIWSIPAARDTGRAAIADIDPDHPGAEGWAVGGDAAWNSEVGQLRAASGELIAEKIPAANFLTWWDGDLLREITDHDWDEASRTGVPTISKWNTETLSEDLLYRAEGTLTSNDTKGNPALQADLLGDWREELITRTEDSTALRIHTTVDLTETRLRTLMSDSQYRLGVAWQNTSYNQPPHPSYFLGEGMTMPAAPSIAYTGEDPGVGERVDGPATAAPEKPQVRATARGSDDDVTLTVTVNKGQNAQVVRVYEDGELLRTVDVVDATPTRQQLVVELPDRPAGTHTYRVELENQHGTSSAEIRVRVRG